jgi:hypothetical protein
MGAVLSLMVFAVMASGCTRERSTSAAAAPVRQAQVAQATPKAADRVISPMQQARLEWLKKPVSRPASGESFGVESGE